MNPFYTIRSEWIKLSTTKALAFTSLFFVLVGALIPVLLAWNARQSEIGFIELNLLPQGIYYFGTLAIIVQAIMVVTTEYRHNSVGMTFAATPQRFIVLLCKWFLYAVISTVMTAATLLGGVYAAKIIGGSSVSEQIDIWNNEYLLRALWVYPLTILLIVTFSMGVAMLVRQTAGAIAIMMSWFLGLETFVYFLPKYGPKISNHGPFSNLQAFVTQGDLANTSWGYVGSLYYFIAWAVGLFILGVISISVRDV
ncbi:multidrug ABC transporter permease [Corynebacterium sp.]|uniref:multidrug ABC transporter permease n=1 Tax=Corynebacterium sp. TaxID=1720 RepID=UPI0026DC3838|nr:multidrug ABC transporter permease [Corynebacterium sp.]MDO5076824.1 multidrug ABC transporter permease [Corynebacterium sp.]